MAHSFVEAFEDEREALRSFAAPIPDGTTLLIDTYDTLEGARRAAAVAREAPLRAVRIDSGDLLATSREVRGILDSEGAAGVEIFASGNLDEHEIERLVRRVRPSTGSGSGSRIGTSADAPYSTWSTSSSRSTGGRCSSSPREGDAPRPEAGLAQRSWRPPARWRPRGACGRGARGGAAARPRDARRHAGGTARAARCGARAPRGGARRAPRIAVRGASESRVGGTPRRPDRRARRLTLRSDQKHGRALETPGAEVVERIAGRRRAGSDSPAVRTGTRGASARNSSPSRRVRLATERSVRSSQRSS